MGNPVTKKNWLEILQTSGAGSTGGFAPYHAPTRWLRTVHGCDRDERDLHSKTPRWLNAQGVQRLLRLKAMLDSVKDALYICFIVR